MNISLEEKIRLWVIERFFNSSKAFSVTQKALCDIMVEAILWWEKEKQ